MTPLEQAIEEDNREKVYKELLNLEPAADNDDLDMIISQILSRFNIDVIITNSNLTVSRKAFELTVKAVEYDYKVVLDAVMTRLEDFGGIVSCIFFDMALAALICKGYLSDTIEYINIKRPNHNSEEINGNELTLFRHSIQIPKEAEGSMILTGHALTLFGKRDHLEYLLKNKYIVSNRLDHVASNLAQIALYNRDLETIDLLAKYLPVWQLKESSLEVEQYLDSGPPDFRSSGNIRTTAWKKKTEQGKSIYYTLGSKDNEYQKSYYTLGSKDNEYQKSYEYIDPIDFLIEYMADDGIMVSNV